MKIYLVEARTDAADGQFIARKWVTSKSAAASARADFQKHMDVRRDDLRTTVVDLKPNLEGLVNMFNAIASRGDEYLEL